MIREDRELLAELARLNKQLVTFARRVMEARLSPVEQHAVACWLLGVAEAIQSRAQRDDGGTVEGKAVEDGNDNSGDGEPPVALSDVHEPP